jgi:hypothetical protein
MVISVASIFSLLVTLLVLGVIVWLAKYAVATIPIADPLGRVIVVVVTVICCIAAVLVLLQFVGLTSGPGIVLRP